MARQARKILFSVDLEEFDIPEEYGFSVPVEQKLEVSLRGMQKLDTLMDEHKVQATIFTTAFWALQFPGYMKELAAKHEIASHTFYHDRFNTEDLLSSRLTLTEISGQDVVGLRMPRMQDISRKDIKDAGYAYDSSLHPTWLPGRYNHFNKPRKLFQNEGIWELPASVTPVMRIPIFWLAFKNFPLFFYKTLCNHIMNHDGYIVFYVHPWEFTDLAAYPLPGIVKKIDGDMLLNRLENLFRYLNARGEFVTHRSLLNV